MEFRINRSMGGKRWRSILVLAAIACLTFSLATRYCSSPTVSSHANRTLQRRSLQAKRQHLDRDVSRWFAQPAPSHLFVPTNRNAPILQAGPVLQARLCDESLYNRPPPSFELFLES